MNECFWKIVTKFCKPYGRLLREYSLPFLSAQAGPFVWQDLLYGGTGNLLTSLCIFLHLLFYTSFLPQNFSECKHFHLPSLFDLLSRYFVDEVRYLQDYMTVELLYQFSRQAIMKVVY